MGLFLVLRPATGFVRGADSGQTPSKFCLVLKPLPNNHLFPQPRWIFAQQRYGPTSSLMPVRMAAQPDVLYLSPPSTCARHLSPSVISRWPSAASPKSPVSITFSSAGRRVPLPTFSSQIASRPAMVSVIQRVHCTHPFISTR